MLNEFKLCKNCKNYSGTNTQIEANLCTKNHDCILLDGFGRVVSERGYAYREDCSDFIAKEVK